MPTSISSTPIASRSLPRADRATAMAAEAMTKAALRREAPSSSWLATMRKLAALDRLAGAVLFIALWQAVAASRRHSCRAILRY